MRFIKEDILEYIQRIVNEEEERNDTRKTRRVELNYQEWNELISTGKVPTHCDMVHIDVMPQMPRVSRSCNTCHITVRTVEIVRVR